MERVSLPWRIEMLGGLQVIREGQEPLVFSPQQSSALLAYLALHFQKNHTREELIERLWSDEEAGDVQKKLRRSLYLLRQRFEQPPFEQADLLLTTSKTLGLDANLVSTDVQDFKDALSAAASTNDLSLRQQYLARAVGLYRGDLLPGFYQDCFLSERNRLSDLYTSALHLLTQVYEQAGDLERAIETARRTVALDPLMEEAHCTLMRLFAEMGQPSAVLRQYQELERVLKEAFGEQPSAATRQLMETLRERAQANVPRAVNGRNSKLEDTRPSPQSYEEAPPTLSPEILPDSPEAPRPVVTALPGQPAPAPTRRPLLVGAIMLLALLIAVIPLFLRRKVAPPKSGLLVPNAKQIWAKRYPLQPDETGCEPTDMTMDAAGNTYITGFVHTLHNDVDFLTLKYDPNGKLIWHKRYNGPGNDVDRARSIAVDKDGNVYVTGDSDNGKGNGMTRLSGLDWATIKYGPDGNPSPTWPNVGFGLGVRRYNGPDDGEDRPVKVCVDSTGTVYVAGNSLTRKIHQGKKLFHQWVFVTYNSQGKQTSVRQEHFAADWLSASPVDMVLDPLDNVYVTGYYGDSKMEMITVKYDRVGDCVWRKTYSAPGYGDVVPTGMALDGSGNVYVTGHQYDGDLLNNGTQMDIVTLEYDPNGNELWHDVYDLDHRDDVPHALTVDKAGNVAITGHSSAGTDMHYLTLLYASGGKRLWARYYRGTVALSDDSLDVTFDHNGNVIVTGYALDAGINRAGKETEAFRRTDNVTIKYDRTHGALWKGVYEGGSDWSLLYPDAVFKVAVDNQNCVIMTGLSDQGSKVRTITTIKYAPDADTSYSR
ncbi:MAG TPA: SBBP repeat-containing protein [Chthonomonadaceae bacterium]|nr:SBBP repeat-containing protein [Chthonomonadaceae bacterium]